MRPLRYNAVRASCAVICISAFGICNNCKHVADLRRPQAYPIKLVRTPLY